MGDLTHYLTCLVYELEIVVGQKTVHLILFLKTNVKVFLTFLHKYLQVS